MTRERFIELVTAEQEPLRRFLLALCGGDRAISEDIAQDALVKAYLASGEFVEHYKIAYRTFLDYAKRPHRLAEPLDERIEGGERADATFRYEALYHAIDQLPEQSRAAVLLYHIEGYSFGDIATITHSNPIAVRQRLSRGLRQLKIILERSNRTKPLKRCSPTISPTWAIATNI